MKKAPTRKLLPPHKVSAKKGKKKETKPRETEKQKNTEQDVKIDDQKNENKKKEEKKIDKSAKDGENEIIKETPKYEPKVVEKKEIKPKLVVDYSKATIASFCDIEDLNLEEYIFNDVPISTFDGIVNLKNAKVICVKNALFTSFKFTKKMPNLKKVSFENSPISLKMHYRIMVLYAFGSQIEEIDGKPVDPKEKSIFQTFDDKTNEMISEYLYQGGIIFKNIDHELIEEIKHRINIRSLNPLDSDGDSNKIANSLFFSYFWNQNDYNNAIPKENQYKPLNNISSKMESVIQTVETQMYDYKILQLNSPEIQIKSPGNYPLNIIENAINNLNQEIEKYQNDGCSKYDEDLQTDYNQIKDELNSIKQQILSNPKGLNFPVQKLLQNVKRIYDKQHGIMHFVQKLNAQNNSLIEMISPLNSNNIYDSVLHCLNKGNVYLVLLEKMFILDYLQDFMKCCQESSRKYHELNNVIENISQSFNSIIGFTRDIINNYESIKNYYISAPKYSDMESSLDQAKSQFFNQVFLNSYDKIHDFNKNERIESKYQYQETKQKIDKLNEYMSEISLFQGKNNNASYFVQDVVSNGEETLIYKYQDSREPYLNKLNELISKEEEQDEEIKALLAQCKELNINVD